MLNKHRAPYRLIVVFIAYAIAGAPIFATIGYCEPQNHVLLWVVFGIYCACLVATVVITELIYAQRRKKNGNHSQG